MSAATIRVRRPSGKLATFEAECVTIEDGLVTAKGRWRDDPDRQPSTYTWTRRRLIEIAWTREAARAA